MPTVWDQAKTKRTDRRNEGINCQVVPALVNQLNAAALLTLGTAANNTNNTYVVAKLVRPNQQGDVFLALGIPVANRGALVLNLNNTLNLQLQLNDIVFLGRETNLHAEMSVVRHVCNTYQLNKGGLGNGTLTVACSGKPVCADCCGWMTRHGIHHGPNCSADGSSQGWMHPITGATFRGESDADFTYMKSSKYQQSATQLNPDPKPA